MDNNTKTSILNNSSYGQRQSEKLALYNSSRYAQVQQKVASLTSNSSTATKYTTADGKVLVRNGQTNRIDFKTLFSSLEDDSDLTTLISKFKTSSDNMLDACAKRHQSYINKKTNS